MPKRPPGWETKLYFRHMMQCERELISWALSQSKSARDAADMLGIAHSHLRQRMILLGLHPDPDAVPRRAKNGSSDGRPADPDPTQEDPDVDDRGGDTGGAASA